MATETKRITSAVQSKYFDMLTEMAEVQGTAKTQILQRAIEALYQSFERRGLLGRRPVVDREPQEWR